MDEDRNSFSQGRRKGKERVGKMPRVDGAFYSFHSTHSFSSEKGSLPVVPKSSSHSAQCSPEYPLPVVPKSSSHSAQCSPEYPLPVVPKSSSHSTQCSPEYPLPVVPKSSSHSTQCSPEYPLPVVPKSSSHSTQCSPEYPLPMVPKSSSHSTQCSPEYPLPVVPKSSSSSHSTDSFSEEKGSLPIVSKPSSVDPSKKNSIGEDLYEMWKIRNLEFLKILKDRRSQIDEVFKTSLPEMILQRDDLCNVLKNGHRIPMDEFKELQWKKICLDAKISQWIEEDLFNKKFLNQFETN